MGDNGLLDEYKIKYSDAYNDDEVEKEDNNVKITENEQKILKEKSEEKTEKLNNTNENQKNEITQEEVKISAEDEKKEAQKASGSGMMTLAEYDEKEKKEKQMLQEEKNRALEDPNYSENKYAEVIQGMGNNGNNRYGVENGYNNNSYNTTGSTTTQSIYGGDSYFDGGLLQLIGWRILTTILTAITFGLASPWAECMMLSWQYKHTVYNGKRLKFEGTGGSLFGNMLKWILLSIVTFGIYILFIPIKKEKWVVSKLHFENRHYGTGDSFFDGTTLEMIGVNIVSTVLTTISFGLLFPYTVCYKLKWLNRHTVINNNRLIFKGKALNLFGNYIKWFFLTLITFGIYGLWIPIKTLKWETKNTRIRRNGEID